MSQATNLTGLKIFTLWFMLLSFFWFKEGDCAFHTDGLCSHEACAATAATDSAPVPGTTSSHAPPWPGQLPIRPAAQSGRETGADTGSTCLAHSLRRASHNLSHTTSSCALINPAPMSFLPYAQGLFISCNLTLQFEGDLITLLRLPVSCCLIASILAVGLEVSSEKGSWSPAVLWSVRQNANPDDKVWNLRA